MARFAGGLFGEADAGDLRMAVSAGRDGGVVERMHAVHAGDLFDTDDAFVARFMREPGRPGDIADGVETRRPGAAPFVDRDVTLVDFDAERLESEPLDIAGDADG